MSKSAVCQWYKLLYVKNYISIAEYVTEYKKKKKKRKKNIPRYHNFDTLDTKCD